MNEELILKTINENLIVDEAEFIKKATLTALEKLTGYGYEGVDVKNLTLAALEVREFILNYCNISEIPRGLLFTWVNLICASYLELYVIRNYVNKDDGGDKAAIAGAVHSITEGDVSVTYMESTSSDKILNAKSLMSSLMSGYKAYLTRYRKLVW